MGWIASGYHFVSSLVQCTITHSSDIAKTVLDLATCISGKLFQ